MQIQVSNLSANVFADDLERLFAEYGEVAMAVVFRDSESGRSKGVAIIDMPNDEQAVQAMLCLDQTLLDGRMMELRSIGYSSGDRRN
ncbi:MAG TPA: RNA-binding protein [Chitinophagaceae bacterium]|jgi:RNA recognition motif-containing protein|nr:RNA-binding protein [Chitinophagaceae bacterium]